MKESEPCLWRARRLAGAWVSWGVEDKRILCNVWKKKNCRNSYYEHIKEGGLVLFRVLRKSLPRKSIHFLYLHLFQFGLQLYIHIAQIYVIHKNACNPHYYFPILCSPKLLLVCFLLCLSRSSIWICGQTHILFSFSAKAISEVEKVVCTWCVLKNIMLVTDKGL